MKSFFQHRKQDKPAEPATKPSAKAYKIWIPPSQPSDPARPTKVTRASDYVEVRAKGTGDTDKSTRRTAHPTTSQAAPTSSSKPHKSQSAVPTVGPSALSAAAPYAQPHKPKHSTSAPAPFHSASTPSTSYHHATSTTTQQYPVYEPTQQPRSYPTATPIPVSQYSSLPSSKPALKHTYARSRTIPNPAQPEFWMPPTSEDAHVSSKQHKDRSGHSRSRTDPTTATVNPQIWLPPEPPKKPKEKPPSDSIDIVGVPLTKSHRSHKDTDSVRPSERTERTEWEREREREKKRDREKSKSRKEDEKERRRDDSDVEKSRRKRTEDRERERPREERERPKEESERHRERRVRSDVEKASSRPEAERDRRDSDRKHDASTSRHAERERHTEERERHASSREARDAKPRTVPVPTRSYDDYESSDSARPKPDSSSRHRRHRTDSLTKESRQYPPVVASLATYEPPIRPLSSPFLANVQAPGLDYQTVMMDSDSASKKEKQRHRDSMLQSSVPRPQPSNTHSTITSANPSRTDPRQVIGTPVNMEKFAVPAPDYSSSSREVTPRKDDSSSLEAPSRAFPPPTLPPVTGPTSHNGLGVGVAPPHVTTPPRDSPVITKSSPGKRSLQEKTKDEYGVLRSAEYTPPTVVQSQASASAQPLTSHSTSKSSLSKRDTGESDSIRHRRSSETHKASNEVAGSKVRTTYQGDVLLPSPADNTFEVRAVFSPLHFNPDVAAAPNLNLGASIPRSSTSMAFRRDDSSRPVPMSSSINQLPSFASHVAVGASLQRPSTAAGYSQNHSKPTIDTSALARAAFTDQQQDRLSHAQSAPRTPFPPQRSGVATPLASASFAFPPERPRADSNSSMTKGMQPLRPDMTDTASKYPSSANHIASTSYPLPTPVAQQASSSSQYQSLRDNFRGPSTAPPQQHAFSVAEVKYDVPSTSADQSAVPPRDMSTPKPYRHPILTDLLTSPTNNTKYMSAVQKSGSAPWDYDARQQSLSAQEPSHITQHPQFLRRGDPQQEASRDAPPLQATAFAIPAHPEAHITRSAPIVEPVASRHEAEAASLRMHRAGAPTPAIDSSKHKVPAEGGWKNSSPRSSQPTYGADHSNTTPPGPSPSAPSNTTPPSRSATTSYDSYATRSSSVSASNVPPPSQAVHRPSAASYPSSSQLHQQNSVSLPQNTHVVTAPTTQTGPSSISLTRPLASTSQPRHTAPTPIARTPSHDSIMKTPSSLAASVLKKTPSRTSLSGSLGSQTHESKKKSFLGIFKSKAVSTPAMVRAPLVSSTPVSKEERSSNATSSKKPLSSKVAVPPPTSAPPPQTTQPGSNLHHSSSFTPFKYLSSKRHRTVSGASLEALHGTATNTVVGSPTASMLSSNPAPPPPVRDPVVAAREWSNAESSHRRNGKLKVRRPGVVFELKDEHPPEDKPKLRSSRRR
ncbi:hypothetical protein BDZ89DRAFT_1056176 [Hymenopellis radicata]|nr:hypothetical protein BDZ89DRAFT_1056176 [Hymenopellis radicata]